MKHIDRTNYMNRLIGLKNTPDIKIITGIRRSGKSELLHSYTEYLKENDANANIIFIDYFDLSFDELKNYKLLYDFVMDKYDSAKTNYLFIDEVQLCNHFELAINSFHNSGKFDIYITGSNAFLLSSDLATLFTGRFIEIHVFPFSFKEYCEYYRYEINEKSLDKYLIQGGLAGSYNYNNEQDRSAYIADVYETIVKRDLVDKYKLPDSIVLEHLCNFLMDNIANLNSPNKISGAITANITETNHVTIGRYIKYLCNAYMFYNVKRYDIHGKKYLQTSEKYYLCDLGFRYTLLGTRNMDYGRAYENLVCIELNRRGYEVYIGKLYQNEIDFIATKGSEKVYIQVSDDISTETTFEREVKPLLQIKDAYPKVLIAKTGHDTYQYEGIQIHDIAQWLAN